MFILVVASCVAVSVSNSGALSCYTHHSGTYKTKEECEKNRPVNVLSTVDEKTQTVTISRQVQPYACISAKEKQETIVKYKMEKIK